MKSFSTHELVHPFGFLAVGVIFLLLVAKHYDFDYSIIGRAVDSLERRAVVLANEYALVDSCDDLSFKPIGPDAYVCTAHQEEDIYDYIFQNYPKKIGGKEQIYSFLSSGDRQKADKILNNIFDIDRYEPVQLKDPLTWREDPYGERYWRFLFYSLRPLRHVLATGLETRQSRYFEKLGDLTESFLDVGMDSPHAWDDIHGAAFRTMMLVNIWWKMREANELTEDLSHKILNALPLHAEFLLVPENFEVDNNHGITEAAALIVLAQSFPDLPDAEEWMKIGKERMILTMETIVDPDGVLVENSPYYHFYSLEKFWQIYKYSLAHDVEISKDFEDRVEKMFRYATYILQPNGEPPLIGASIPRRIQKSGEFKAIAEIYPEFDFVLTQGREGRAPERRNIVFPSSGQAIFRSDWKRGSKFDQSTYMLFDMGPYRTDHSELDALNFHLYARGDLIIRDTGLYTYETTNNLFNYFYGTYGHNTIVVDGKNQDRGEPVQGEYEEAEGWVWQSAYHSLYDDVVHHRVIALLGDDIVFLVDELDGTRPHTYEALFHLDVGTTYRVKGFDVTAETARSNVAFRIEPLLDDGMMIATFEGDMANKRGLCANAYEVSEACPEIVYEKQGISARYMTVVSIGDDDPQHRFVPNEEGGRVTIEKEDRIYEIVISYTSTGRERQLVLNVEEHAKEESGSNILNELKEFVLRVL